MRPIRKSVSSQAASAVIAMDWRTETFNVGVAVDITGTCTYSVEYTYDDVQASTFDPSTAKWFTMSDMSAKSADADAHFQTPCTGIRLNVTAYTNGTATITVVQAG